MTTLAVYREPFSLGAPRFARLPDGLSLLGLRRTMPGLPEGFDDHGVICVNGVEAPRALWGAIKPKASVTEVTFHMPPRGGEDGAKNILSIVASIAITVATGFIAGGGLATQGGWFAARSVSALALAGAVSLGASLLMSALVAPPTVDTSANLQNPGAASATGNVLQVNAPIPRVIGQRKVYPPMAMEPVTYFDGPDELVEAAYVLNGPHQITDIRLGAAAIAGVADIEYETREGWIGSPLVTLLRRQARTDALQAELRGHVVSADDGRTLDTRTGDIASALPQVQVVATKTAPDEHQLQLIFAQGLHRNASETNRIRVPVRLRLRAVGSGTWVNLPELHFQAANIRQLRTTIRLVWTDDSATTPEAAGAEGWVEARVASPGQTIAPVTSGWAADAYFVGSGDDWVSASNLGTTGVSHISLDRYTASIFLDTATFPKGRYEVEVQRGSAFLASDYNASAYTYDGDVWDFWGYQGLPGQIALSRDGVMDSLYILRSVSVWDENPLPSQDLAVVAIRARNRAVDAVSCVAGGLVKDWNGTGWEDWVVTDNPAPHLRDILTGMENENPVPLDLIDEDGLVDWRQACIDLGYTCNALIEDQSLDDAARIVASCGYARPYMSDVWGVVRDKDRSADAPLQVFTPRNMANFQWTKGFALLPDGLRVNFRDASRDYEMHQISVFRDGVSNDSGNVEQVTYEGIIDEADARARAIYDQAQARLRNTFYSCDVSAEVVLTRQGDLVAVQHDILTEWAGSARIVSIETDTSGDVVALVLDTPVPVADYDFLDDLAAMDDEDDLSLFGVKSGVVIRREATVTTHQIAGALGPRIEFSPPLSPVGIYEGGLVGVGPMGAEYLRLIVASVRPKPNFEATITFVDEAPELWSA